MKKLIILLLLLFCVGCGMTPGQKNAVKALDNNADFFVKHVKPTAKQPIQDVIDANKALTKALLESEGK